MRNAKNPWPRVWRMLDELLGRAELKDRIGSLEAELRDQQARLTAEEDRRREAVRERQEAEERVNRLEDRIADLEGQLDRAREGEWEPRFRGTDHLRRQRLSEVLDRLAGYETRTEGALTAMVEGTPPDQVREAFGPHAALVSRAAPCLALTDDAGIVSVALTPPLPPEPFVSWGDRFELDRAWFEPTGTFGFALVRSDVFAYAEYDGWDASDRTSFETDVMGRHSKGGFSQARFERRRNEQIDAHLERCRGVLEDRASARLIVVGERTVIDGFDDLATRRAAVDASGDPADALDDAFESFWTSTLYRV